MGEGEKDKKEKEKKRKKQTEEVFPFHPLMHFWQPKLLIICCV